MTLKLVGMSTALFLLLLAPVAGHSTPLYYSVHGTIVDHDHNQLPVTGSMYIDDQLRTWDGGGAGQPVALPDLVKGDKYQYTITGYSLTIGQKSITGTSGNLNMQFSNHNVGDTSWSLDKAAGGTDPWSGEMFRFYDRDGSRQDPSEYGKLAELIELRDNIHGASKDHESWRRSKVWLERENPAPAPVPEPATILLVGAGLVGMIRYRKSHPSQ